MKVYYHIEKWMGEGRKEEEWFTYRFLFLDDIRLTSLNALINFTTGGTGRGNGDDVFGGGVQQELVLQSIV